MPWCFSKILYLVQLGAIGIYWYQRLIMFIPVSCSFFFAHVSLQVASIPVGFRRQVGDASVYLRLLLRPPRPVPAEKEEKEETRGAAAGLRDRGLMIWDWKYAWVYPKKIFVSPQQTSGLILRDYFNKFLQELYSVKESETKAKYSYILDHVHEWVFPFQLLSVILQIWLITANHIFSISSVTLTPRRISNRN